MCNLHDGIEGLLADAADLFGMESERNWEVTMESLEKAARAEWELFKDVEGWVQKECVALGFDMTEVDAVLGGAVSAEDAEPSVVWYELKNVAEPSLTSMTLVSGGGRGEFLVEGEELQRVLQIALEEGLSGGVRLLWHTHVNTASPSAEDIREFPSWLADYGMVYHVPTGVTTLYSGGGVISNTGLHAVSLATSENDRAPMYGGADEDGM